MTRRERNVLILDGLLAITQAMALAFTGYPVFIITTALTVAATGIGAFLATRPGR